MPKKTNVPEYSKFDPQLHWYAARTASGDGWRAMTPINKAIRDDMLQASDNAFTDEQTEAILKASLDEWIDGLEVYDNEDNLIASFNTQTWKWA